jgi:hypothetical protein
MPELVPDTQLAVKQDSALLVPDDVTSIAPVDYVLTVTGTAPFQYDWRQPTRPQILEGNGDPNGLIFAPKGTLYDERDAPDLWQNTDGGTTWAHISAAFGETYLAASVSGSITVDLTDAVVQKLTMTGNITPTFAGAVSGRACGLTLYLVQDGTGSRLVTWGGSVKWPFGSAPLLSTAANAIDIVVMESYDGGTSWFANFAGKAYA